jgi:hypothetical protein
MNVVAHHLGFRSIEHDEILAAISSRLRSGGLRFLVPHLAVDDGGVATLCVSADVFPDVEHRTTRGVDERAAPLLELLEQRDRYAERRQDHHVGGAQLVERLPVVGEEADSHRAQLLVDMRVVDDFAGEEDLAVGKALARLVCVVDRAIHAIAEAELASEMHGEAPRAIGEVLGLDPFDDGAVIVVSEHPGDGMLQVEAFAKD